jgi:hypothetical protein
MKEEPSLIFKVYILMKNPKTGKNMATHSLVQFLSERLLFGQQKFGSAFSNLGKVEYILTKRLEEFIGRNTFWTLIPCRKIVSHLYNR